MHRIIPRRPLTWWERMFVAAGATVGAWAIRVILFPIMLDQGPYLLFFVSVLVTGLLCGWELAVLGAIAGGIIANVAFVPPYGAFALSGKYGWGFALYFLTALVIVWLTHSVKEALERESALSHHLETISDEYRHRMKNLVVMVQALVRQSARHTDSMEEFEEKIVGRLQALSHAQDLLSDQGERTVPISRLFEEILKPFGTEGRMAWPPVGPEVEISSSSAVSLALILNELATNATKYGALSVSSGRLKLNWVVQGSWVTINWRECDGPPVRPPLKKGFGSRLLAQGLPRASGEVNLSFDPEGLFCEIKLAVGG